MSPVKQSRSDSLSSAVQNITAIFTIATIVQYACIDNSIMVDGISRAFQQVWLVSSTFLTALLWFGILSYFSTFLTMFVRMSFILIAVSTTYFIICLYYFTLFFGINFNVGITVLVYSFVTGLYIYSIGIVWSYSQQIPPFQKRPCSSISEYLQM